MPVAVSPCPVSVGQHGRRLSFIGAAGTCPWAGVSPGGGPCAPPPYHITAPGTPAEGRGLGKRATAVHTDSYLGQYSISLIFPQFFPLPSPMQDGCGGAQRGVLEARKQPPSTCGTTPASVSPAPTFLHPRETLAAVQC